MAIIKSVKLKNKWFIPNNVVVITIFPFILVDGSFVLSSKDLYVTLKREQIHIKQQKELLIIGFYLLYFIEWVVKLLFYKDAYRNISFEREAYENQYDRNYESNRKCFSFLKYII